MTKHLPRTPTNVTESSYKLNWTSVPRGARYLGITLQRMHYLIRCGDIPVKRLDGSPVDELSAVPFAIHKRDLRDYKRANPIDPTLNQSELEEG